jgi:hypothetical protein
MSEHLLTDDDILKFTQGTRRKFVDHILANGFPNDPKDQHVLLTTLADMDRTALGNKRIGAAEKMAESDKLVAEAISRIGNHYGGRNPFEGATTNPILRPDPELLPNATPAPGETAIGLEVEDYAAFIKRMES